MCNIVCLSVFNDCDGLATCCPVPTFTTCQLNQGSHVFFSVLTQPFSLNEQVKGQGQLQSSTSLAGILEEFPQGRSPSDTQLPFDFITGQQGV